MSASRYVFGLRCAASWLSAYIGWLSSFADARQFSEGFLISHQGSRSFFSHSSVFFDLQESASQPMQCSMAQQIESIQIAAGSWSFTMLEKNDLTHLTV